MYIIIIYNIVIHFKTTCIYRSRSGRGKKVTSLNQATTTEISGATMVNDGQRWSTMVNDGQRWSTMVNDGQRWSTMVNDGQLWQTMANDGKRWPTMANDGQRWSTTVNGGQRWSTMVNDGQRWSTMRPGFDSQVEFLRPDGIEVLEDGLRPSFGLPDLDGDVRIARPRLVLPNQALGTDHCKAREDGSLEGTGRRVTGRHGKTGHWKARGDGSLEGTGRRVTGRHGQTGY